MRGARARQAGFTFVEVTVALALFAGMFGVVATLLVSTDSMSKTSHLNTRATAEHRRNLESLANVVRTADSRSLDALGSFDDEARSTEPRFQRVTGVDLQDLTLAEIEHIEWRAKTRPVNGVDRPGELWLVGPTGDRLVADRIPQGGFEMRQEGAVLAIRLTTYYSVDATRVSTVTSETAVMLRN